MTSFPDYLVLHMRRFAMEAGWVPKKLGMFCLNMPIYETLYYFLNILLSLYIAKQFFYSEVYIDVPDIIDISHMRSKGQQDGEELLPDGGT